MSRRDEKRERKIRLPVNFELHRQGDKHPWFVAL
jgi:hypothetical protein